MIIQSSSNAIKRVGNSPFGPDVVSDLKAFERQFNNASWAFFYKEETETMKEFILVEFDEGREVIIDGYASGYQTGQVIDVVPGTHTISLEGPNDFSPREQDVNPSGTSPVGPHKIGFQKV